MIETMLESETIAAIATATTNAGIGIVRISGGEAVSVADRILRLKSGKRLEDCPTHTIHYGFAMDGGRRVDEVMVALMRAPKSYTREDTVEIDCHGGTLVMRKILELAVANGARPAEPGEFTKRAFLNGRIDLAQAESVIDLITSKNDFALRASMNQLGGSLSGRIRRMREIILQEAAYLESAIDDPEHYPLEGYGETLLKKLEPVISEIGSLLDDADKGALLREGIQTVIVGKPNSGKSSLLNLLAGRERAIVTDIAGTTRDAIEEQILLGGISLNVIDTAGIRSTENVVERIGVEKAREYVEQSDLALCVIDSSLPLDSNDEEIIELIRNRSAIVLLNKSDLEAKVTEQDILARIDKKIISISAKYNEGIDELEHAIEEMFFHGKIRMNDEVYLTNARHKALLSEARDSLNLVRQSIAEGMPEDFYTIDLMNAYGELGKIIGEAVEEDLVNEIFSKFCMGK